jgi:ABC-type multidrug transport system ATPase subunit
VMKISIADAGKRFNRDWIFRKFSYQFHQSQHYAITGPNGSGKSTLLQVIAGAIVPSEGVINFEQDGKKLEPENFYTVLSIAAPYLELIEEMTLTEFLDFHKKFKPFRGIPVKEIIAEMDLSPAADKQIRYYSSGMKQRVKLAQAIFSDTALVLLDEPTTNLDHKGIALYLRLINDHCKDRTVIVSSNEPGEYSFCEHIIQMSDFKPELS